VVEGLSGHVDLSPTIFSLAGLPSPPGLEEVDLSPRLVGEDEALGRVSGGGGGTGLAEAAGPRRRSIQDQVFIEIRGNVSIITDRWKMGLYPHDGDGDLYDLAADPFELVNRFPDPSLRIVRDELRGRILAFSPTWPPAFSVVGAP